MDGLHNLGSAPLLPFPRQLALAQAGEVDDGSNGRSGAVPLFAADLPVLDLSMPGVMPPPLHSLAAHPLGYGAIALERLPAVGMLP